jgi:two-component system, chemotaxis family, chemotaxis protein CheY
MGSSEQTGDSQTIRLPAVLDLAAAEALQATLRQSLAAGRTCKLDAAQVESLLLPGIQVILAALRSSGRVAVTNPSPSFCAAFEEAAISWQGVGPAAAASLAAVPPAVAEPVQAQAAVEASTEPPRAKRILTIDDSKTMRDMLRFTLVDAGYDVLQAVDGQDGLDVLSRERVDVVITDINMPKLDGYGVIRHLRADAGYDDTPILVLSTESDQKTKDIGRDAGATGWLVKPFDPAQLVEIVRQVSP